MKYESANTRMALVGKPTIKFRPSSDKREVTPRGIRLGVLDTQDARILRETALDSDALVARIEKSNEFKRSIPGSKGIWRKEDRIKAAASVQANEQVGVVVDRMNDVALRNIIASYGVAAPVNADRKILADLAKDCLTGKAASGTVPDIEETETETQTETETTQEISTETETDETAETVENAIEDAITGKKPGKKGGKKQ